MVVTFLVITFIASICDNIIDFLAQNLEPKIEVRLSLQYLQLSDYCF